jgi:hypothetical protein
MSSFLIGWVSRHVLPHERALRLAAHGVSGDRCR